ncbi:MAG: hypothetical protein LBB48_04540 [Treponema sp.]|nr:hypothetical protein [Treponema sp.]
MAKLLAARRGALKDFFQKVLEIGIRRGFPVKRIMKASGSPERNAPASWFSGYPGRRNYAVHPIIFPSAI